MSALSERPVSPVVGLAVPHESAALHVTGEALYTDDLVGRTKDVLHAYPSRLRTRTRASPGCAPRPRSRCRVSSGCSPPRTCPA